MQRRTFFKMLSITPFLGLIIPKAWGEKIEEIARPNGEAVGMKFHQFTNRSGHSFTGYWYYEHGSRGLYAREIIGFETADGKLVDFYIKDPEEAIAGVPRGRRSNRELMTGKEL